MLHRAIVLAVVAAVSAVAQTPFPIERVAEVSFLGEDYGDGRRSVDLGLAQIHAEGRDTLRIEGQDDAGLPWVVRMAKRVGSGRTRVFTADLDSNGRLDLLIAASSAGNGQCVDSGVITAFLFDEEGRPAPWRIQTHGFGSEPQVTLHDLDRDGRAEIVVTGCDFAYPIDREPAMDEHRWISVVYEANDARWTTQRIPSLDTDIAAIRRSVETADRVEWVSPAADARPADVPGSEEKLKITGLLRFQIGHEAQADPRARVQRRVSGYYTRVRYSDGSVRPGCPGVVFDSAAGREADLRERGAALELLLSAGLEARLLDPIEAPSILWVDQAAPDGAPSLARRLDVIETRRTPIELVESIGAEPERPRHFDAASFSSGAVVPPGSPSAGGEERSGVEAPRPRARRYRTWLSRGGRCVEARGLARSKNPQVAVSEGCEGLGPLSDAARSAAGFYYQTSESTAQAIFAVDGVAQTISAADGSVVEEMALERVAGRRGDLIAVTRFASVWLAQWDLDGETWLTMHSDDGAALDDAIALDVDGRLFGADLYDGLTFLRWENGAPVERITVVGYIEHVRAQ